MRCLLSLERIGDSRCWVAELVGVSDRYWFDRHFIKPLVDYSHANSKGTRGVVSNYMLREGVIYEVQGAVSWGKRERYFCRVVNGSIMKQSIEEVLQWLSVASELTSTAQRGNE